MSNFWNPDANNGDQEEDDEEEQLKYTGFGRDSVIFMIDTMLSEDRDQFQGCLECIEAIMQNRILTSDRDLLGIVFYNTEHSPAPLKEENSGGTPPIVAPKNTAIFMPMKTMSKETILHFKNFKNSDDLFDLAGKYGTSKTSSFVDGLWLCARMIMGCDYKVQSSTIILFTNNEQPHRPNTADFQKSFTRAKDLRELGVHLLLVPMVDEFDAEPFYREFICIINDDDFDTFALMPPEEQRNMLKLRTFQRDYRRACHRYFQLKISDTIGISCGLYSFTKTVNLPKSVKLMSATNEVVVSKRSYVTGMYDEELCQTVYGNNRLMPGEELKVQQIGGQKICFTPEELTRIKSLVSPGMHLLGFKPLTQLPKHCFVKPTRFVYPVESTIKGSTTLFRALWERCLENEKFIMCVFCQVRKIAPRYVALVPQQKDIDGNDGFRLVFLPMQTDQRKLDIFDNELPDITADGYEPMSKIVKKLRFNYKPELFEDPQLKSFYGNLEALVFDEPGEEYEDATLPDADGQDGRIGPFVDQLTEIFGVENSSEKRPAASRLAGGTAKQMKVEGGDNSIIRTNIIDAINTNNLSKITVAVLKEFLQGEGISGLAKMTKPMLIEKFKSVCDV